jgi:hypothetical protein
MDGKTDGKWDGENVKIPITDRGYKVRTPPMDM